MQRSYPLCWLALAIGLLGTQCVDSISDDCTKTLTCGDNAPVLGDDCIWRYPDDQREWEGGPQYDPVTRRWRWPDGTETATQNLVCNLTGDAGSDAGPVGPDCRRDAPCDPPLACDLVTGSCVECLTSADCSGATPVGDAGAAVVCDEARHECVRCLENADCMGGVCKVDASDSSRNECVECQVNQDCGAERPVCDESTNECTTSCDGDGQCGGNKPVCNTTRRICVECLDATTCTESNATQCDLSNNECVECIDDSPCSASGRVCDTESNRCVECREDAQCAGRNGGSVPYCDTEDNVCVACLTDQQCTNPNTSRCNPVLHACVGCNSHSQCENGLLCNANGACVECLDNSSCSNSGEPLCETTTGQCVQCLNPDSSECRTADRARCDTNPASPAYHQCVGCESNADCANKPVPGLCNTVTDTCVDCLSNAECTESTASRCQNGTCDVCSVDADCNLFPGARACRPDTGCVECTNDTHCVGNSDGPICKLTNTGAAEGSAAVNTCVECVSNSDCPGAGESLCQDNQCVPCVADADCSHVDSNGRDAGGVPLQVCDAGACVQCTGAKREACGVNVCDSLAKTCTTDRPAASAGLCDDCVSDFECTSDARCVQQTFGGTNVGFFCVPLPVGTPASCNTRRPYFGAAQLSTLDSQGLTSVCVLRQTTCLALDDSTDDCEQDSDCGAAGIADGLCVEIGGGNQCTTPCVSANDCTGVADCTSDGCEL